MKTIIIGKRSILTKSLVNTIKNTDIISANEILKYDKKKLINLISKNKFNLIINSFFPSKKINSIIYYSDFVNVGITSISKLLDIISPKKINKIIYSSSSSVYNINNPTPVKNNRHLYGVAKNLCENILYSYSKKNKIDLIIARIFNMYGEDDDFSAISKILKTYKTKKNLIINNNGSSIRDFIHVKDVSKIYEKILKTNIIGNIDIGLGYGIQIKEIIKKLNAQNFKIIKKNYSEQNLSIAENLKWKILFKKFKPILLENFIIKKLKIKNKFNLNKVFSNANKTTNQDSLGTIIYGCGNAGKQIHDSIIKNNDKGVYCFVDDDPKKINKRYKGKKIISFQRLKELSRTKIINSIIISIPSLTERKIQTLFKKLYTISKNVYNLPIKTEYDNDKISLEDIQNSEFIHIFKRKNSKINLSTLKKLKSKKILITGAGGSIGSELSMQLSRITNKDIICLDHSELALYNLQKKLNTINSKAKFVLGSINDKKNIQELINKEKIQIVFHTAAYKHVNFLEMNVLPAVKNNILGTLNIIEALKNHKTKSIKMINISTDKAAQPSSVLGMTKRISEIICDSYKNNNKFNITTVRFGNVFASQGSAINLFLDKINNNQNIEITNKKVERYFMSTKEACGLVIQASQLTSSSKTYILDMGQPVKIYDLVKKMVLLKKVKDKNFNINIVETGLGKGEKIKEILSINKKSKKTKIKNILETKELQYNKNEINLLVEDLNVLVRKFQKEKTINRMKDFLKREILIR